MLIFEMTVHLSCREFRGFPSDKQELRPRGRLNKEKERTRFLRRLLQSSYTIKRVRNKGRQRWISPSDYEDEFGATDWEIERKPASRKRTQQIFIDDNVAESNNISQSCCPQRFEIIEPISGRNKSGHMMLLYKDERIQQRFYELICEPTAVNKPCRFLEGRNLKMSKCTQQHAYTYALVSSIHSISGWSLDHIRIRSGCTCKVYDPYRRNKFVNSRGN